MCLGPEVLAAFQTIGAVTGAVSAVKSLFGGSQQQQQQMPAVAATSPIADDNQAKADAAGQAQQEKSARLKLAQSASLLTGSAAGDLSTANVSKPGATAKTTLGA